MTTPPTSASTRAKPLSPALDKTFKIGLVLKGLDGILEVAGGILLLVLSPHAIQHLVRVLTAHELSEDPHDLIARSLLHSTAHLNTAITIFGAIYLLSHGIAKIVLVGLVLRDKLWAYPWLIVLLLAFIAYQLYRITAVRFSIGLTLLTIFDAFLVWLTWREYRAKRDRRHQAKAPVAARASQDQPGEYGSGQERIAEVVHNAAASGAGEQPAQQQAAQAHGPPDQAEAAEHPAANAVQDARLDGGAGGMAGGGAGPVAHQRGQRRGQRGDAGEHKAGQAAPPERGDDDDGAAGAGRQPGQQDRAGEDTRGDAGEQPVSAGGGQPAGGQDTQQGAGRPRDDHPPTGRDHPERPGR